MACVSGLRPPRRDPRGDARPTERQRADVGSPASEQRDVDESLWTQVLSLARSGSRRRFCSRRNVNAATRNSWAGTRNRRLRRSKALDTSRERRDESQQPLATAGTSHPSRTLSPSAVRRGVVPARESWLGPLAWANQRPPLPTRWRAHTTRPTNPWNVNRTSFPPLSWQRPPTLPRCWSSRSGHPSSSPGTDTWPRLSGCSRRPAWIARWPLEDSRATPVPTSQGAAAAPLPFSASSSEPPLQRGIACGENPGCCTRPPTHFGATHEVACRSPRIARGCELVND